MGVVEHSSGTVEACLSALEESYDEFSVNQTTIPVPATRYEHERERANDGHVDLYIKVRNDDGMVLHVSDTEGAHLPSTTIESRHTFETAVSMTVSRKTGIDCRVTGVEEVTILGVCDAEDDDRDTVCRPAVLFEATREAGTTTEDAHWRDPADAVTPGYI